MNLAQLPLENPAHVARIVGLDALSERLMEMGLVPGAEVLVVRQSRFGSPLEVLVQGYRLCLRAADAQRVEVT